MQVQTVLLGTEETLEVSEEQFFSFEAGLSGFEGLQRFALVQADDSVVDWLVSLDDPTIAFAVIEPFLFEQDYAFELSDDVVESLGLREPGEAMVRCVLTLNENPALITANLRAPLVLSLRTRQAQQVILTESDYSFRARVLPAAAMELPAEVAEESLLASA